MEFKLNRPIKQAKRPHAKRQSIRPKQRPGGNMRDASSDPRKNESTHKPEPESSAAIETSASLDSNEFGSNSNTPDVSQAIEQVLLSKTEARRKRKLAGLETKKYHFETQRPLVCLAFVLPLLAFYEIGSIFLGDDATYLANALRSGIDQWFHQPLAQLGFGQLVLLPLVTVGVILAWHHRVNDHWRIRPMVLLGMLGEAAGLGLILFCAANSLNLLFGGAAPAAQAGLDLSTGWWANAVSYVGSGIYEELIFRIILLVPAIYWLNKVFDAPKLAVSTGVIAVSLIFASMHYSVFNPAGNQFELSSFMFRFGASIIFCALFLCRGFGIAVGTHVAYDVLTQV